MKIIGNIIWWLLGGLLTSFLWFVIGLVLCCTVIFIPFGMQCLKISRLLLWPFGSHIEVGQFGFSGFIFNIIWICLIGWELAIIHLLAALLCSISIIGIPLAGQHLKLAKISFLPFGSKIH